MEPRSIRAKTTLIYKAQLVDDALEAKQAGGEVADLDAYLLPPALWEHYQAERKPRPAADEEDDEQVSGRRTSVEEEGWRREAGWGGGRRLRRRRTREGG